MFYRGKHRIARAFHAMTMQIRLTVLGILGGGAMLGLALVSLPSGAAVTTHTNYTGAAGAAGYSVPQSGWRFRDVNYTVYIRAALAASDTASLTDGLSNPSNGDSALLTLTGAGAGNPLTVGVSVDGSAETAPAVAVSAGDTVRLDVFYNKDTGWLHFTVDDVTTGVQRDSSYHFGYALWYSPELLAADTAATPYSNTSPAGTELANLTLAHLTTYNVTHGTIESPWNAQVNEGGSPAEVGNPASGVTSIPSALTPAGTGFKVFANLGG